MRVTYHIILQLYTLICQPDDIAIFATMCAIRSEFLMRIERREAVQRTNKIEIN